MEKHRDGTSAYRIVLKAKKPQYPTPNHRAAARGWQREGAEEGFALEIARLGPRMEEIGAGTGFLSPSRWRRRWGTNRGKRRGCWILRILLLCCFVELETRWAPLGQLTQSLALFWEGKGRRKGLTVWIPPRYKLFIDEPVRCQQKFL
jgi:hypothetical protein